MRLTRDPLAQLGEETTHKYIYKSYNTGTCTFSFLYMNMRKPAQMRDAVRWELQLERHGARGAIEAP